MFMRFAGMCAIVAGVGGLLYSVLFVLFLRGNSSLAAPVAILLTGGGLLTVVVLLALYETVRAIDAAFARVAVALGVVGALGAAIHGAYDLSLALHPVTGASAAAPSAIDPRGFLTFGVAGAGLLVFAWLITRSRLFPRPLGYLAYLSAALLIVIYLTRLIILTATNPLVIGPAAIEGLIVNPAFYIWLGLNLRKVS